MELELLLDKDCWCYKYRPLIASLHTLLKASSPKKHAVHCGTFLGDEIVAILKCLPQNCPTMHFDNHLEPVSAQAQSSEYIK